MAVRSSHTRPKPEPTIALINIVFLMLIFFMIAGALTPPLDSEVSLVETADLDGRSPPDAAVIRADGTLILRGAEVSPDAVVAAATEGDVRLIPDRALPATDLMRHVNDLRVAGAEAVWIITERGMQP